MGRCAAARPRRRRASGSAAPRAPRSRQPFLTELCERAVGLRELEAHAAQHLGGLREVDVRVVDDLDVVAPGVAEVKPATREDFGAGCLERLARRLLVVDDEPEVPVRVRRLRSSLREGDELIADVDERHPSEVAPELELEDPAVPLERLVDVADFQRDVVDANEPRHLSEASWLGSGAVRPRSVYETVVYASDLAAVTAFYRDVLGLREVDDGAFRLDDGGMLLLFDPARS